MLPSTCFHSSILLLCDIDIVFLYVGCIVNPSTTNCFFSVLILELFLLADYI